MDDKAGMPRVSSFIEEYQSCPDCGASLWCSRGRPESLKRPRANSSAELATKRSRRISLRTLSPHFQLRPKVTLRVTLSEAQMKKCQQKQLFNKSLWRRRRDSNRMSGNTLYDRHCTARHGRRQTKLARSQVTGVNC
jgi:hypothetical protein